MKLKLKHQLRDGSIVEIEGEPVDLARFAHELDKIKISIIRNPAHAEPEQIPLDSLSYAEPSQGRKRIRTQEIVQHIYSIDKPDMYHSMRDLMVHFFGEILPSKDKQPAYLSFYNKVVRAHQVIEAEKNGSWDSTWELDKDGRYRVYRFVQK